MLGMGLDLEFQPDMAGSVLSPNELPQPRQKCVNGAKLFNSLPKALRNLKDVDLSFFKLKLDQFLSTVADEPQSPGYTAGRRAASNSLLHMIPACRL